MYKRQVYTPADSKESTADITNPFCGFYKINGYVLAEDKTARDADIWCQRSCKDTPYPLMLLEINLRNYADQDLSANALSQLNRIFKICEKKKKQIILRLSLIHISEPTVFISFRDFLSATMAR